MSDGFLGDRVHDAKAVFFDVNYGASILPVVLEERLWDCVHGGLVYSDVDEVK